MIKILNKNGIFSIIIACLISSYSLGYSQIGICPPETISWNSSNAEYFQPMLNLTESLGNVDYKWNSTGGMIDIFVDWNTLINTSSYFNLNTTDLKSLLTLQIIHDRVPCPQANPVTISFIDVVQCRVERNCYVKVSKDQDFVCIPPNWPDPQPVFAFHNGDKVVVKRVTEDCGISCCKTIYLVSCTEGTTSYPSGKPTIIQKMKQTVPGSECNSQIQYFDCLSGDPVECKSRCQ
jgi:hypothetical protein